MTSFNIGDIVLLKRSFNNEIVLGLISSGDLNFRVSGVLFISYTKIVPRHDGGRETHAGICGYNGFFLDLCPIHGLFPRTLRGLEGGFSSTSCLGTDRVVHNILIGSMGRSLIRLVGGIGYSALLV